MKPTMFVCNIISLALYTNNKNAYSVLHDIKQAYSSFLLRSN